MDGTNKFLHERPSPGREQLLLAELIGELEGLYRRSGSDPPENAYRLRRMNEAGQEEITNLRKWIDALAPNEFRSFIEQVETEYKATIHQVSPVESENVRRVAREVAGRFLPSLYEVDDSVNRFEGIR